jgi:glycosyltransferase involved in cell wall biosynthesis
MIFPEGDAQALARIIRSLATPESRALAGRRGRERVLSMYTNQRIAADLAGLYRSLLAPSP